MAAAKKTGKQATKRRQGAANAKRPKGAGKNKVSRKVKTTRGAAPTGGGTSD